MMRAVRLSHWGDLLCSGVNEMDEVSVGGGDGD